MSMNTEECLRQGDLQAARQSAVAEVKASPGDESKRFVLFLVFCFLGEWDKARKQLEFIKVHTPAKAANVLAYENILQAEISRHLVWSGSDVADFLPEKPGYATIYARVKACYSEDSAQARRLIDEIWASLPGINAEIDGKVFSSFHETDSVLSFCLEAFVYEKYVWIPFAEIRELTIAKPQKLIDLLWASAQLTTLAGLTLNCYLPVLYPNSFQHQDDRVKLGRMTDWIDLGNGLAKGVGQHVYAGAQDDISFLSMGEMTFKTESITNE